MLQQVIIFFSAFDVFSAGHQIEEIATVIVAVFDLHHGAHSVVKHAVVTGVAVVRKLRRPKTEVTEPTFVDLSSSAYIDTMMGDFKQK